MEKFTSMPRSVRRQPSLEGSSVMGSLRMFLGELTMQRAGGAQPGLVPGPWQDQREVPDILFQAPDGARRVSG